MLTLLLLVACDQTMGDDGPYCEATRSPLRLDEAAPNGVIPADLLAWAEMPVEETLTWADGGATPLHLQATHTGEAEWVDLEAVYPDGVNFDIAVVCEDYLAIPVDLGFATDDGAFADTFAVELAVAEDDGRAEFAVDLMAVGLAGAFDPADWPEGEYDELSMSLTGDLTPDGSAGTIAGNAVDDLGCDEDGVCTATSEQVMVATWGAASG